MLIDEIYATRDDEPVWSFEFFPAGNEEGEQALLATIDELRPLAPAFVSVTYGAGGATRDRTVDLVRHLNGEQGILAMPHLTCVGASVDHLCETLDRLADIGVENVLALRGDPPKGQPDWQRAEGGLEHSSELVALIRDRFPFAIGAACFPETHINATSPEDDLRHLKTKVDAGAGFLITQLFFDNAAYFSFVERARAAGITVPIVPGIMPVTSVAQLGRITELCGANIPAPMRAALDARDDGSSAVQDFGVAYATLQCAELLAGGAPGIHFYTLNRSPATRAIVGALQLLRPWAALREAPVG